MFFFYAAFTHAGLTTGHRMKNFYKSIFVLSSSRNILFVKRIESLLHKLSLKTWKSVFTNTRFRSWSSKP